LCEPKKGKLLRVCALRFELLWLENYFAALLSKKFTPLKGISSYAAAQYFLSLTPPAEKQQDMRYNTIKEYAAIVYCRRNGGLTHLK